jgi:WD40 repeat protein
VQEVLWDPWGQEKFRFPSGELREPLARRGLRSSGSSSGSVGSFSPDGRRLALSTPEGLQLWDATAGREIATLKGERNEYTGHAAQALAFSPDGKTVAAACPGHVLVLGVPSWDVLAKLPLPDCNAHAVAFSPDGKRLAAGVRRGCREKEKGAVPRVWVTVPGPTVWVWDVATRKEVARLAEGKLLVLSVAFSPDGRHLATAAPRQYRHDGSDSKEETEGQVRVWDLQTGKELPCRWGEQPNAKAVAFTPDGRCLAVGKQVGNLELWHLKTGRKVATLPAAGVEHITFSPDGTVVATGGFYGVELWHLPTGRKLGGVAVHALDATRFTPDGRTLRLSAAAMFLSDWSAKFD